MAVVYDAHTDMCISIKVIFSSHCASLCFFFKFSHKLMNLEPYSHNKISSQR